MGFVYFCIPVISGYYIMDYAISIGKKNNQIHFDKIKSNSPEHATLIKEQNKALQDILDKAKADKFALEKKWLVAVQMFTDKWYIKKLIYWFWKIIINIIIYMNMNIIV